jgi:hypothetical protein
VIRRLWLRETGSATKRRPTSREVGFRTIGQPASFGMDRSRQASLPPGHSAACDVKGFAETGRNGDPAPKTLVVQNLHATASHGESEMRGQVVKEGELIEEDFVRETIEETWGVAAVRGRQETVDMVGHGGYRFKLPKEREWLSHF